MSKYQVTTSRSSIAGINRTRASCSGGELSSISVSVVGWDEIAAVDKLITMLGQMHAAAVSARESL